MIKSLYGVLKVTDIDIERSLFATALFNYIELANTISDRQISSNAIDKCVLMTMQQMLQTMLIISKKHYIHFGIVMPVPVYIQPTGNTQ